jgi:hypothetical protein
MNVGELIDALSKYPRELPVMMSGHTPRYVDILPGYYDGPYYTIGEMDGKDVMKFDRKGDKIHIYGMDISDFVWSTTEEVEFTDRAPMSWEEFTSRIQIGDVGEHNRVSILEKCHKYHDKATTTYINIITNMEQELIKSSKEYTKKDGKIYPSGPESKNPLNPYQVFALERSDQFSKEGDTWIYNGQKL